MKRVTAGRLLVFFGILMITAGMTVGGSLADASSPSWLTEKDYIEVAVSPSAAQSALQLFPEDMEEIRNTLLTPVAWWANGEGVVSSERRQLRADVYAVDGPFAGFHPVRMLKGSFLSPFGNNPDSIVLDENLAWQLFGTADAVGLEVEFQGITYTVTGICAGDTSLLGLLSGNGLDRAYIGCGAGAVRITGMAAALPKSLPGKSMQAVKDALGLLGKNTDGFLFRDVTEGAKLDAETTGLPALLLAAILTVIAIVCVKMVLTLLARRLRLFLADAYFTDSLWTILRHIGIMALVAAAAAGLVCLVWLLTDFPFFLPGRYIPVSWIDIGFYKTLLQSQAQDAVFAMAYIPEPWKIARDAGMQIAGYMNMTALAGTAVSGAGFALLRVARETQSRDIKGLRSGGMDIPAIWIFFIISLVTGFLICSAMGIGIALPLGRTAMLCAALTIWAAWCLYKARLPDIVNRLGDMAIYGWKINNKENEL